MKFHFPNRLKLLTIFAILCILSALANIWISLMAKSLIDFALSAESLRQNPLQLLNLSFIAIGAVLVSGILQLACARVQNLFAKRQMIHVKNQYFSKIFKLDFQTYFKVNTGEALANLTANMGFIESRYYGQILMVIFELCSIFITLLTMLYFNVPLTVIICILGVLPYWIPRLLEHPITAQANHVKHANEAFYSKSQDYLAGYEVIKTHHIQSAISNLFKKYNQKLENSKYTNSLLEGLSECIAELTGFGSYVFMAATGIYMAQNGWISLGTVIAMTQMANGVIGPIMRLSPRINKIKAANSIIESLNYQYESSPSVHRSIQLSELSDAIRIEHLSFAYDHTRPALQDISLIFEKGKKYLILGPSGCGKSTLLKLISGYSSLYEGKLTWDGEDLASVDIESLLQRLSIVHQQTYLFEDTLKNNLCLYKSYETEYIEKALCQAGLSLWTEHLDKTISESGSNLSGGERQRLSIARALLKGTDLLLFDEATSSLDENTAIEIESLLLSLDSLTFIHVSHRLHPSLMSQYDKIVLMKKGQIVTYASYEELQQSEAWLEKEKITQDVTVEVC